MGADSRAGATADLAQHVQGPDAALGQIVVGRYGWGQDRLEQFVLVTQQALGQDRTEECRGFGRLLGQGQRCSCQRRSSHIARAY